jgi:hypothetical protein
MINSLPRGGTFINVPNAASIILGGALCGCGPAAAPPAKPAPAAVAHRDHAEHDHADHDHDHPTTLAGAVVEVEKAWKQIRDALKAGDRDAADDKVHEVGHLLEDCESLVAKQPAAAREAAKQGVEEIFDCFDTLDAALHGDDDAWKKIDVDGIGKRLDAVFGKLAALAK